MKPFVRNAADEEQVREAEGKSRRKNDQDSNDFRAVLALPEGKRVLARLLARCRVASSVWHPSSQIHYSAGIQDVGHFIMQEIVSADEAVAAQMMVNAYREELNIKGDKLDV